MTPVEATCFVVLLLLVLALLWGASAPTGFDERDHPKDDEADR